MSLRSGGERAALAAALAGCAVLHACGGKHSDPVPSPTTTAERIAALEGVRDQLVAVSGKDPAAGAQAVVDYLRGRTEFKDAGASAGAVWALLRDGRPLVIPAQAFAPHPKVSRTARVDAQRSPAEMEVPEGKAVVVNTVGLPFTGGELSSLVLDLRASGYQTFATTGDFWRLRTDVAYGQRHVFHWKAQSGFAKDGVRVLASSTRLNAEDEANSLTTDDFLDGSLAYFIAISADPDRGFDVRYAVTPTFVRKYMRFPPDSLVFIDADMSDDAPLKAAFFDAGASVFAGWSSFILILTDTSVPVLTFYDGLLGLDRFGADPELRQRSFDPESIAAWMAKTGLDTPVDAALTNTRLVVTRKDDQFGLLCPAIEQIVVDEAQQELSIVGLFGATGDLSVTIGGTAVPVKERHPTYLRVGPLPTKGPGSAGDVRVTVNEHTSNAVQLTEWHGRFVYDFKVETLQQRVTFDVHLRADVHSFRLAPGGTPAPAAILSLQPANDSTVSYVRSGEYAAPYGDCTITHVWTGTGPVALLGHEDPLFYSWHAVGYPPKGTIDLTLDVNGGPAGSDTTRVVCPDGTNELSGPLGITDLIALLGDRGFFHVAMDGNWTIQGATFQTTVSYPLVTLQETATVTLSWADMTASSPPDPNAHR